MSFTEAVEARSSAQWPAEAFHYMFKSAELPAETLLETAHNLFLSYAATSAMFAAGGILAVWVQTGKCIRKRRESCCSKERRLLNKGVSAAKEKRSHVSISQM